MLQLTKRTEYGLIALIHLADRERSAERAGRDTSLGAGGAAEAYVSVREIAEHYRVPRRLLAEVLKDLCAHHFVSSLRGPNGGYVLARPAERITLGEVVSVLEGAPTLTSCASLALYRAGSCDVEPLCPIRSPIQRLRTGIWAMLERTTLRDMSRHSQVLAHAPAHGPAAALDPLAAAGAH
jgi:Rrf2 family protein